MARLKTDVSFQFQQLAHNLVCSFPIYVCSNSSIYNYKIYKYTYHMHRQWLDAFGNKWHYVVHLENEKKIRRLKKSRQRGQETQETGNSSSNEKLTNGVHFPSKARWRVKTSFCYPNMFKSNAIAISLQWDFINWAAIETKHGCSKILPMDQRALPVSQRSCERISSECLIRILLYRELPLPITVHTRSQSKQTQTGKNKAHNPYYF